MKKIILFITVLGILFFVFQGSISACDIPYDGSACLLSGGCSSSSCCNYPGACTCSPSCSTCASCWKTTCSGYSACTCSPSCSTCGSCWKSTCSGYSCSCTNSCSTCQGCTVGTTRSCDNGGTQTCVFDSTCGYSYIGSWGECVIPPPTCDYCYLGTSRACTINGKSGVQNCNTSSYCYIPYGSWGSCYIPAPVCDLTVCKAGCVPGTSTCNPFCSKSCPGSTCIADSNGGHCYENCDKVNCPEGQYCVPTILGGSCVNTPYCLPSGYCSNPGLQFLTCSPICGGYTANGVACASTDHSCAIGCKYYDVKEDKEVSFTCSSYCTYTSTCGDNCDAPIGGNNQCGGCSQLTPNLRCCSSCRRMTGQAKCGTAGWYPECSDIDPTCGACGGTTGPTLPPGSTPPPAATPTPTPSPGPWWQVVDADVATNGDLISRIPDTCTLPVCNPAFDLKGLGGFPGVPAYNGSADFNLLDGVGTAGEEYNWSANSQSRFAKTYNYTYFKTQIPADLVMTGIDSAVDPSCVAGGNCTVNASIFESGGSTDTKGYTWYYFDGATLGDLTITGDMSISGSRKVILLVENGDLHLTGRINLGTPGSSFFMALAGENENGDKGNIIVDPTVTSSGVALEGIYLADNEFRTGTGGTETDDPLYIRGIIAAYGGVVLERNLGLTANKTGPAETFKYAPDLIMTFPKILSQRRMSWKEVAP